MGNGVGGVELQGPLAQLWRDVYKKAGEAAEARTTDLLKYHVYTYPHSAGGGGGTGGGGGWVLLAEIGPLAADTASPLAFTGIPQDKTHLWLHFEGRGTGTGLGTLGVQLNGDTGGTQYSWAAHYIQPSATHTQTDAGGDNAIRVANLVNGSQPAASLTTADVYVPNYAKNDSRYQRVMATSGRDAVDGSGYDTPELWQAVGVWKSGAPVTAVRFVAFIAGTTFAAGTHIQLYGLAASGGSGGTAEVTITTDASLTSTESPANTFALAAQISVDSGNALSLHSNGLFATGGGGGTGNTTMYTQTTSPTGATNSLWFNPSESA